VGLERYGRGTLVREVALLLVAAVFCLPFYVLIAIALQTSAQVDRAPLSLPDPVRLGNFSEAWSSAQGGLGHGLESSLIITVASVAALVALGSLCAYTLARRQSRLGDLVYILFVLGIILPAQLAIIPLFIAMRHFGLVGNYAGMIVLNIGLLMPLTVFLYTGFIRALPRDYEEAAWVDGAGILQTYAKVVFPLLLPVTATVALLVSVVIWNEFFVVLIFLGGSRYQTVTVAVYSLVGDNANVWNVVFAGVVIAIAPVLALFVVAQRQLMRGFSSGVKG
jgi:raffinose/stachyose/melibiose transport system permease protein